MGGGRKMLARCGQLLQGNKDRLQSALLVWSIWEELSKEEQQKDIDYSGLVASTRWVMQ